MFIKILMIAILVGVTIAGGLQALLGLMILSAIVFIALWALTVLLKGFFPWAYKKPEDKTGRIDNYQGLVPPGQSPPMPMNEFIQENNSITLAPKDCPICGKPMEVVTSLPGYYCWKDGHTEMVRNDGMLVDI